MKKYKTYLTATTRPLLRALPILDNNIPTGRSSTTRITLRKFLGYK